MTDQATIAALLALAAYAAGKKGKETPEQRSPIKQAAPKKL
jgi:hypothetical protein